MFSSVFQKVANAKLRNLASREFLQCMRDITQQHDYEAQLGKRCLRERGKLRLLLRSSQIWQQLFSRESRWTLQVFFFL